MNDTISLKSLCCTLNLFKGFWLLQVVLPDYKSLETSLNWRFQIGLQQVWNVRPLSILGRSYLGVSWAKIITANMFILILAHQSKWYLLRKPEYLFGVPLLPYVKNFQYNYKRKLMHGINVAGKDCINLFLTTHTFLTFISLNNKYSLGFRSICNNKLFNPFYV